MIVRTTTALTLGEAARQTGQSKPTILRSIEKGRVSAIKDDKGQWCIEPAELFRVYQPKPLDNPEQETLDETLNNGGVTPETPGETPIVTLLREQIAALRADRDYERERSAAREKELQQEVEKGREERGRLQQTIDKQADHVRLLTDQTVKPPVAPPVQRGFLDWLLGRPGR
jgi:excisionase family DNA binding protein